MFKKKRKLKFVALFIIAVASIFTVFNYNPKFITTDAGFDTDYDSGGSGGGWSSGGGSDWGHDHGSSRSGSSNHLINILVIIACIIYVILENEIKKKRRTKKLAPRLELNHNKEISEDEFNNYLKDKETKTVEDFLDKRYIDLVQIQEAWMDFDYDTLRSKTTDELYNQYSMQLDTLKIKGQKNIMKEFVYNDAMITKVTRENNNLTVTIELLTNFYDYIVNANNTTIRGHKNDKVRMHYELTFVKSVKKSKDDTCPSCGAKLEDVSSQQCPYCKSTITKGSSTWILSKKEAKGQEWN